MSIYKNVATLALLSGVALDATTLHAQVLEEVVVVAQRRTENLQTCL